jgi:hypothetical protein
MLKVTRVAITQASAAGSAILANFDAVLSIPRTRERERCTETDVSEVVENDMGNTKFIPFDSTCCLKLQRGVKATEIGGGGKGANSTEQLHTANARVQAKEAAFRRRQQHQTSISARDTPNRKAH